jgi:RNA polymerase sigma factor (sigma-70 family)
MNKIDLNQFFDRLYDRYSFKLLHWANKRINNITDAEDIVQETMLQILELLNAGKIDINIPQEKLDAYVWKVAYFTWCNYRKKLPKHTHDVILPRTSSDNPEMQQLISKMRKSISRLNYLHREAMILKYLENKSSKEIALKLDITESYVNKLLFDARKIVKENNDMNTDTDYVYRPMQLFLGVSGEPNDYPDYAQIQSCVLKQNICIACYKNPRNIDELSGYLGISKAYIELELEWLIDKEFIEKRTNKYYTMFYIEDHDDSIRIANVYFENKVAFCEKIVEKLTGLLQAY